jgi:cytoskeletal protein RodZ
MSAHLSSEILERFHAQQLTGADRARIYQHVLSCDTCRQRVVTADVQAVAVESLTADLLPQAGEFFHLDAETIEAFVDDTLNALDRSTARLHLDDCVECAAEVTDLRESLATMRAAVPKEDLQPAVIDPSRRFAPQSWIRIAAAIAIIAFASVTLLMIWRWKSPGPTNKPGANRDTTAESQPTPSTSPQLPSLAPSPAVANKDGSEPSSVAVIPLKDGPHEIAIDQTGKIAGLPPLSTESRRAVKEILMGENLTRPSVLDELVTADLSTRGPNADAEQIKIVYPFSTVIQSDKPALKWAAAKTAEGYQVEIADESFRRVAQSGDLPAGTLSWKSSIQLKRGQVYTWTIRAIQKEGEPAPVTAQGKFKVLGDNKIKELTQLKTSQSHLALGLFYAREGMIAEAESEFAVLVKENPDSAPVKNLLRSVRAWRRR